MCAITRKPFRDERRTLRVVADLRVNWFRYSISTFGRCKFNIILQYVLDRFRVDIAPMVITAGLLDANELWQMLEFHQNYTHCLFYVSITMTILSTRRSMKLSEFHANVKRVLLTVTISDFRLNLIPIF